jgi:DNA repair exonuclease SbcCD ATPase subunit
MRPLPSVMRLVDCRAPCATFWLSAQSRPQRHVRHGNQLSFRRSNPQHVARMSTDLTTSELDRDQIRRWLGELRCAGDEFEEFVNKRLDDLDSLSAHLDARQCDLDAQHDELRRQLATLQESQRRLDEANTSAERCAGQLRELTARLANETSREFTGEVAELKLDRERFREQFEAAQSQAQTLAQTLSANLAEARAELVAASADLLRERQRLTDVESPLHEALAAQIALVEEQRAALAAVIATPAAIAPLPAEPVQEAPPVDSAKEGESRNAWSQELDRLRSGLAKTVRAATRKPTTPADPATGESARGAAAADDRVLDSVMAQFEMLQNDLAGRRASERPARPNAREP